MPAARTAVTASRKDPDVIDEICFLHNKEAKISFVGRALVFHVIVPCACPTIRRDRTLVLYIIGRLKQIQNSKVKIQKVIARSVSLF